jgi:hypothetical protein
MYLFHWPLYIIIEQLLTSNAIVARGTVVGDLVIGVLATVATLAFSELSYRYVEKPLRVRSPRTAAAVAAQSSEPGGLPQSWRQQSARQSAQPQAARQQRQQQRQRQATPRLAPSKTRSVTPIFSVAAQTVLVLVVVISLSALSVQALATAPRTSSIQQAYEHEVLVLNVERLDETSTRLATYELKPVANTEAPGAIYVTEETDLEEQRQTLEELRDEVTQNPDYGSIEATYGTVTVIGDSVVMGAISALRDALGGGYIDAEGSRRTEQIDPLLAQLESDGLLGDYVVIGLATNVFNPESLDGARHIAETIGPRHRLVFITG